MRSNHSIRGELSPEYWNIGYWKDWCWSWTSNISATWCKELTHWERPWCWERLKAGGEGDDRGWDGWMASPTQWTWVWASSRSWWRTGSPGALQSMGSERVRHNWATELNWTANSVKPVLHSIILSTHIPRNNNSNESTRIQQTKLVESGGCCFYLFQDEVICETRMPISLLAASEISKWISSRTGNTPEWWWLYYILVLPESGCQRWYVSGLAFPLGQAAGDTLCWGTALFTWALSG